MPRASNPPPVIYAMGAGEPLEDAVRVAFNRFRRLKATHCVLQLDESSKVPGAIADAIAEQLARSPRVRALELVHGSAGAGFVASLLSVRAPNVTIIVTEPRVEPRLRATPTPPPDRPTWTDEADTPRPIPVYVAGDREFDEGVRQAFAEIIRRRIESVALVLSADREIPSEAIDTLAPHLCACIALRAFVLVHPAPTRAYVISVLAQRLPHLSFAGCETPEEARRALSRC